MGKSTLFNRLTQSRQAIVNEQSGTTRDRQYGRVSWLDKDFSIVDTGGWVVGSDDVFEEELNKHVELALQDAAVLLFVVDVETGSTDLDDEEFDCPRIAIVGRPNAGKSSLVNAFIGEERNIVTDRAGTTRDSIYTHYDKFGKNFYLVDTAGIRKRGKVNEDLEYYSVIRSIRAIENSDVCILMLDATRGIESQDLNIFSIIQKNSKGLVLCVNKLESSSH